ncbi:MAG: UDP-3-O-(3-hydroxymyristoyl)glucosamine N-acyltransferase [Armatimonadota bacterium]|nr:UDP-3-O-(3-hydroxymyristoyl)glucosamine N-acyltransferase [Armatimonadota bacterium]
MRTTVRELTELVGGELRGDGDCEITGVSSIEEAMPGDVVFAQDARYLRVAAASAASAIVGPADARNTGKPLILVDDPKYAFARILELFAPRPRTEPGVHPSACVQSDLRCGQDVSIQFCAYLGANVVLGDRVNISPHAYIADNVTIGSDVVIHPFVAIHQGVVIGDRVTIHSGSVIGSDGFGYVMVDGIGHKKIPQIGNVIIGDDVEIGANSAIDRARTGSTEIGSGTKIDNMVHIAHNVKIGRNCLVVALVGIAGTVTIGDGVVLAGQAGVKDNVQIGDGVVVAARAGVIGDVPKGARVSGFPARDHCEQMRATAALQRLPELLKLIGRLGDRIAALEGQKTEDDVERPESGG